jgi:hypothetical protein
LTRFDRQVDYVVRLADADDSVEANWSGVIRSAITNYLIVVRARSVVADLSAPCVAGLVAPVAE